MSIHSKNFPTVIHGIEQSCLRWLIRQNVNVKFRISLMILKGTLSVMLQPTMSLRFPSSLSVLAIAVTLAISLDLIKAEDDFDNEFDQELDFECPLGQFISSVYSVHSNGAEDRRWKLGCRAPRYGAISTTCAWTEDYVNTWDEPISFMCPAHYGIAGIHSVHDNGAEDRRMKFKCCKPVNYKTSGCELSPYLNEWDAELDYSVPGGKILAGWFSVHDNSKEDRRHKMLTCTYRY